MLLGSSSRSRSRGSRKGFVSSFLGVVDTLLALEAEMPLDYLLLSPLSEKTFGYFTDRVLPHVAG